MHLKVGHRIALGPHRGTICYRGAVPPSSGEWLGVEWDDPARGKHDGISADGTRYFHVRVAGSGSFIRPTASKLSSGCCFLEALRNKYLPPSTAVEVKQTDQQQYSRKNIADIEIEAPNLDRIAKKAARLDRLKEVGLGGWQHSSIPDVDVDAVHDGGYEVARAFGAAKEFEEGSIRGTCPNIRWLDLSRSLLPEWEEVSLIAGELEHLRTLWLHFNRLQSPPEPIPETWQQRLGHIQDLRLDGTLMQWEEVLRLAPALASLKHLSLGSNEIKALHLAKASSPVQGVVLPSLTSLSLEDNLITFWPDLVAALSRLPALQSLNLNHNQLADIPGAPPSASKLQALTELHIRDNHLESWPSLKNISSWLSHSQGLDALHISTLQDEESLRDEERTSIDEARTTKQVGLIGNYEYRDFRAIAIARLPTLKVLDKTEITAKERKDAELFVYTRFRDGDAYIIDGGSASQESKLDLSNEEKVARFPRYLELAKLFDGDESLSAAPKEREEEQRKSKNTLRSRMLSLTVIASDTAPGQQRPYLKKEGEAKVQVLASTPLRLAKIKLANAVGVKPAQIAGIWALLRSSSADKVKEDEQGIVLEIDDMSRSLDWYEVSSGDQLVLVIES
ncbi:related to PAC2 - microtubule effector required for tubulin heterodimer formation [Ustilago sp. UG-2017a]|nr:related to PAC2 - microtubule effector required for tubulin heterodimer formation [Ustilago sp. UG-2017a]